MQDQDSQNSELNQNQRELLYEVKNVAGVSWSKLASVFQRSSHSFLALRNGFAEVRDGELVLLNRLHEVIKQSEEDQLSDSEKRLLLLAELDEERAKFASTDVDVNRSASTYTV